MSYNRRNDEIRDTKHHVRALVARPLSMKPSWRNIFMDVWLLSITLTRTPRPCDSHACIEIVDLLAAEFAKPAPSAVIFSLAWPHRRARWYR